MINYDLLTKEAEKLGIDLGNWGVERFDNYAERLVRWNAHVNLTSITDADDIVIKHFIDCLYILNYVNIRQDATLVDIGSGGGFPGMPLLITNPDLNVTFIDSVGKKLAFIKDVLRTSGMVAEVIHKRAEEVGKDKKYRESFDYATARAVAPLNILCEYALPLVKLGGLFIAMKGSNGLAELADAQKAISVLGGEVVKSAEFELPNGDKRTIIIIRKISQTPTKYPRKTKKIDTKPL